MIVIVCIVLCIYITREIYSYSEVTYYFFSERSGCYTYENRDDGMRAQNIPKNPVLSSRITRVVRMRHTYVSVERKRVTVIDEK